MSELGNEPSNKLWEVRVPILVTASILVPAESKSEAENVAEMYMKEDPKDFITVQDGDGLVEEVKFKGSYKVIEVKNDGPEYVPSDGEEQLN